MFSFWLIKSIKKNLFIGKAFLCNYIIFKKRRKKDNNIKININCSEIERERERDQHFSDRNFDNNKFLQEEERKKKLHNN